MGAVVQVEVPVRSPPGPGAGAEVSRQVVLHERDPPHRRFLHEDEVRRILLALALHEEELVREMLRPPEEVRADQPRRHDLARLLDGDHP